VHQRGGPAVHDSYFFAPLVKRPARHFDISEVSADKAKFGHSVRSKCDGGQVDEVLTKVLCHNMCILIRVMRELGVETTFGAGSGLEPKLFI
jgi:hypothetical protein